MYISLLTALTFAGARDDLSRVEIDTLTALSTWSGVKQIDADFARIAARSHYSKDATKKALASLENKGLIAREARFSGGERLTSIIYVDWRSALAEECRDDYDRLASEEDGSYKFPPSRENNPHIWGDEPATTATSAPQKKVTKTIRNTIVPEDWRPSDKALNRTRERYPSIPLEAEIEKFIGYYRSKNIKRSNWDATWRTWCAKGNEIAKEAWTQKPSPGAPQAAPAINPATGKEATKEDFWYACIDHDIDPNGIINFWKPPMGLPGTPGWPEVQAYLYRQVGRA